MRTPKQVAQNFLTWGDAKSAMSGGRLFLLGCLAGLFIAFASVASTHLGVLFEGSLGKLLGALFFPVGLVLVVLAGSELFTGDCLLIVPTLAGKLKVGQLLRILGIAYVGNIVGSVFMAAVVSLGGMDILGNFGAQAISVAATKCGLSFAQAFFRGVLCNILVCCGVWIASAADSVGGKIAGFYLPIALFVLCGFEHCVANMYYLSCGLFAQIAQGGGELTLVSALVNNLLPVTLGNIVGGAGLVGGVYWAVYLRGEK